jgi:filamentous hemagglutinin family protein
MKCSSAKRNKILTSCAATLFALVELQAPGLALANPVLDNIAAGQAAVTQAPGSTVINQSSSKAILNWKSFNIGASESTVFQQPAGGIALNRISGSAGPSQIYGSLQANGQIILVNPAGIFFGSSAHVNVGGIIASTANITDSDFMNNQYRFTQDSSFSGSIINQGEIIAANYGLVALLGTAVRNDGTIRATMGHVVLASGSAYSISFDSNNMIYFSVDGKSVNVGQDQNGNTMHDAVQNTGNIQVAGGALIVSAQVASNVLDNVINMGGMVQVQSVAERNGEIILSGDKNAGRVTISGNLDASGKQTGQSGGTVNITGNTIFLAPSAVIDVSGDSQGGNINIGGNAQGQGPLLNADAVTLASGATLLANAIDQGNGGHIVLWSQNATRAYGEISATGGATGGQGGLVETSSQGILDVNGIQVNTSAAHGQVGTWLLDPVDITINNSPDTNITGSSPFQPATQSGSSFLSTATLLNALVSNNVTVQTTSGAGTGSGDITVDAPLAWSGTSTLSLTSVNKIFLNADITALNGGLTLKAANISQSITSGSEGSPSLTGVTANINVSNFNLMQGQWYQVGSLPAFSATNDFQLNTVNGPSGNLQFIRAASGDGSSGSPLVLMDIYGLEGIGSSLTTLGYNYTLGQNIDAGVTANWSGGQGATPIGGLDLNSANYFTGSLNGNNFQISNFNISHPLQVTDVTAFRALFNATSSSASLSNFGLSGTVVVGTNNQPLGYGAFLVGYNMGMISNVNTSGSITGTNVASLAVYNLGSIVNSSNTATVAGGHFFGGLVVLNQGVIANSYNSGTVTSLSHNPTQVGGLVALNYNTATSTAYIINSYNTGSVLGDASVGGIAGENEGFISGSYNSGTIVGRDPTSQMIGGLVGNNGLLGVISNVYNIGVVTGHSDIGGIVGFNNGAVSNAYNSGVVSGSSFTGGLVADNAGTITNSFWDTDLSTQSGAIARINFGGATSTQTNIVGGCLNGICTHGGTANLSNKNTYLTTGSGGLGLVSSDWDFNGTWGIGLSTPFLWFTGAQNATGTIGANRLISGTAPVGAVINLVDNGSALSAYNATADSNGLFSISVPANLVPANSALLLYLTGSTSGNTVVNVPSGDITGLSLLANTLTIGGTTYTSTLSNDALGQALGGITDSSILYSLSSSNLVLTSGTSLSVTPLTLYNLTGNVTTSGIGTLAFNGPVNLSSATALTTSNSAVTFGSTIDGLKALSVNAGTGTITMANNVGFLYPLSSATLTGTLALLSNNNVSIKTSDTITLSSALWTGTGKLTLIAGNTIQLNGPIQGANGSLALETNTSSTPTITTSATANMNVLNFYLLNGYWSQISATLPSFTVQSNFHLTKNAYSDLFFGGNFGPVQNMGTPFGVNQSTVFVRALSGNGSVATPYALSDVYGLQGIQGANNYILSANINAQVAQSWKVGVLAEVIGRSGFEPIGLDDTGALISPFIGILNGNNFTVSNLPIRSFSLPPPAPTPLGGPPNGPPPSPPTMPDAYAALIGELGPTGSITNINLTSVLISNTHKQSQGTASLVGLNLGSITNAFSSGSVTGTQNVGGLVANNGAAGSITNSGNSATVVGTSNVGGLVGLNNGSLSGTSNTGSVTGSLSDVGGLVGFNANLTFVTNSFNTGAVSGRSFVGGLLGYNNGTAFSDYNTGTVTGVSGTNAPSNNIGGIAGINDSIGFITDVYNTGAVNGNTIIGGIAGNNNGRIENALNTGVVNGVSLAGGLLGTNSFHAIILNSFWNTDTSLQSSAAGQINVGGSSTQTNLTGGCLNGICTNGGVATLDDGATFSAAGWDMAAVWTINQGVSYPTLSLVNGTPNLSSRIISGIAPPNTGITLIGNGSGGVFVTTTTADANGVFAFSVANGVIADGSVILLYPNSGSLLANAILFAPNNGYNISSISFTPNTVTVGNNSLFTTINNSTLSIESAQSSSIGSTILYNLAGNTLTLNNGVSLVTTLRTTYALNGSITTSGTGALTFNGPVTLTSDTQLSTDNQGSLHFNSIVDGAHALLVNAGSFNQPATIGLSSNIGAIHALTSVMLNGDIVLTNNNILSINTTTDITLGRADWQDASSLTLNAGRAIYLNGNISAPNGTLSLNAKTNITSGSTSNPSVSGVTAGINVKNFVLTSGNWSQNQANPALLPAFSAYNFTLADMLLHSLQFLRAEGGSGTVNDPYILTDIYGVQGLGSSTAMLHNSYRLANNIDASGTVNWNAGAGFLPIGKNSQNTYLGFTGNLNGNNFQISNFYIAYSNSIVDINVGFISVLMGSVSNLGLSGTLTNAANVIIGDVLGTRIVGASLLAGILDGGSITNSHTSGNIFGQVAKAGGLAGDSINGGSISNSYNTATVRGLDAVGGLVGFAEAGTHITHSYNAGTVYSVDTTAVGEAGGLVGALIAATITDSWNVGTVYGVALVGGLVGQLETGGTISHSYNAGTIIGTGSLPVKIGGLVGQNAGSISDAYNAGIVIGTNQVGGIAGQNFGSIQKTYNSGFVSGASNVGGIVGDNMNNSTNGVGSVINSFWDTDLSGQTSAIGFANDSGTTIQTNNTGGCLSGVCTNGGTANLGSQAIFQAAGWDFTNTWGILSGASEPYLAEFFSSAPRVISGTAPASVAPGTQVNLLDNGQFIQSTTTDANGAFSFLEPQSIVANGSTILVYLASGNVFANFVTQAPQLGGNLSGGSALSLLANTIQVGANIGTSTMSDSGLTLASGGSVATGILYGLSNGNLMLANNTSLVVAPSVIYTIDSNINAQGSGSLTFNGFTNLAKNVTLTTNNQNINFGLYVNSIGTTPYALTANAGSGVINVNSNLGTIHPFSTISLNSALSLYDSSGFNNNAALVAANSINLFAGAHWSGSGTLALTAGQGIDLEGAISGVNGSLTLSTGSSTNSITSLYQPGICATSNCGVTATVNVANFNLLQGAWNQVNPNLPAFVVTSDFELNSGHFLNVENLPPAPEQFIRALGGNGSSAHPYLLSDIYGVQGIGSNAATLGYSYQLANAINASTTSGWNGTQGFLPIGIATVPFSGLLEGNNYTLSGLFISRAVNSNIAMFDYTAQSAVIRDLTLTGAIIGSSNVAALVVNNSGLISNVVNAASVTGSTTISGGGNAIAGLVAFNTTNGVIINASNTAAISGLQNVAGLVSQNQGSISNSFNTGTITGTNLSNTIAGLVANNGILSGDSGGIIINSYNAGIVSGLQNVGGLVGNNYGTITGSYNVGTIRGVGVAASSTGGLVAFNQSGGNIISSYNANTVSGETYAGGLVGKNAGTISLSYNTSAGNVSGFDSNANNLAGLVGDNLASGLIINSNNAATVTGKTNISGLVAENNGSILNSNNSGAMTGTTFTAGLVALNQSTGVINNSFNTGPVSGSSDIAGLVATNNGVVLYANNSGTVTATAASGNADNAAGLVDLNNGLITNSYNTGNVVAPGTGNIAGGLVATNSATGAILNTYNTGSVGSASQTGGLAAINRGDITNSYNSGAVTGTGAAGLIGNNIGVTLGDFWNTNTSGTANGVASGSTIGITGATTAQMTLATTFTAAGWSPGSWNLTNGSMPVLFPVSTATRLIIGETVQFTSYISNSAWAFMPQTEMNPLWNSATLNPLPGQTIALAVNGALVDQVTTLGNSSYYVFSENNTQVPDNASLLLYLANSTNHANTITTAPASGASLYTLYLANNTVLASDNGQLNYTYPVLYPNLHNANFTLVGNDTLAAALGNLSGNDFLYTASNNDINVKSNFNFVTAPNAFYQLTGNLSTTAGSVTLNGLTQVGVLASSYQGNVTIQTSQGGNIANTNLIVWPGSSFDTLNLVSANNIYLGSHVLGAALNLSTLAQNSSGSLNLIAANTNESITTGSASQSSIQVQNFNLEQGKWYQDQTGLNDNQFAAFNIGQPYAQAQNEPIFTVYGSFEINSGVMPSAAAEFQRFFLLNSQHYLYDWYGLQGVGSDSYTLGQTYYLYSSNQIGTNVITGFWNNNQGFVPIGNAATPFTGTLYGSTIGQPKGLTINRPNEDNVGLFGVTAPSALLSGVYLSEAAVNGGNNVGGLVGFNQKCFQKDS